ncbi:hypothetical protein N7478_009229 [Penicillium angulare]|uniref:uncharacterized protein n=1 Tax=Penicillium angulare TaxID=116970 RepID=UPI0025411F53|nr:uncharacterized protein N7478_009229 [Penicillium angulare]KAJ5274104.1 hypothetical protein N7478_009229 [Penicillium angulare]
MSNIFRRTSDFFKHYDERHGSVDSTKSTSTPAEPNQAIVNSPQPEVLKEAPVESPPSKISQPKQRRWSLSRQEDEESKKKRQLEQLEKDRVEFAATRKYVQARRRSAGAGIGFEGGWQG